MTDDGLAENAMHALERELTHRREALADAAMKRVPHDSEPLRRTSAGWRVAHASAMSTARFAEDEPRTRRPDRERLPNSSA
jgi:hypothetical protein